MTVTVLIHEKWGSPGPWCQRMEGSGETESAWLKAACQVTCKWAGSPAQQPQLCTYEHVWRSRAKEFLGYAFPLYRMHNCNLSRLWTSLWLWPTTYILFCLTMDHNGFQCIETAVCFSHDVVNLKLSSVTRHHYLCLLHVSCVPFPLFCSSVGADAHWRVQGTLQQLVSLAETHFCRVVCG